MTNTTSSHGIRNGCVGALIVIALIGILVVAGIAIWAYSFGTNLVKSNPALGTAAADVSSGFARKVLVFGSKGAGPGMFSSAHSVAVEDDGNILVGDAEDGRVQTFDPSGKYLSSFSVGEGASVDALLVGTDGKVYVAHDRIVSAYSPSGQDLGQIENAKGAEAMAFGPDGSLYILTIDDAVKRFDASGKLTLTIPEAFSSQTGNGESTKYIAADKAGNIYIIGDYSCTVLKYSPTGQFLTKFGGKARSSGPAVPGTVFNPSGIVVDGYERVFVSDWNTDVEVFQTNGKYIQSIDAVTLGFTTLINGMNIDKRNKIYLALGDQIMELQIQAPSQQ